MQSYVIGESPIFSRIVVTKLVGWLTLALTFERGCSNFGLVMYYKNYYAAQ